MTFLRNSAATICLVLCGLQSAAVNTTYKFTVENVSGGEQIINPTLQSLYAFPHIAFLPSRLLIHCGRPHTGFVFVCLCLCSCVCVAGAYLAANLARNGQLPVHISQVAEANDLVTSLTELISDKTITESCDEMQFDEELVSPPAGRGKNPWSCFWYSCYNSIGTGNS